MVTSVLPVVSAERESADGRPAAKSGANREDSRQRVRRRITAQSSTGPPRKTDEGSQPSGGGRVARPLHTQARSAGSVSQCASHSATATSCCGSQKEWEANAVRYLERRPPADDPPGETGTGLLHTGCTTRLRGRSCGSTVAIGHQTIGCALSTNCCLAMFGFVQYPTIIVDRYAQPWFTKWVKESESFDVDQPDVTLLALFAGWAAADQIGQRLGERGFDGVRFSDGLILQHLVGAERTVGELAQRMEVTQQAASKAVADLQRRGWVELSVDPDDRRSRLVGLSERGRSAVAAGRVERAELVADLLRECGPVDMDAARRVLSTMINRHGGDVAIRSRRVLPPR
jgi:DNA-binding MarR family transcriptional regulator